MKTLIAIAGILFCLIRQQPDESSLLFTAGAQNYQLNEFGEAVTYFSKAYKLKPNCKTAYLMADCYSHLQNIDSCAKYAHLVLIDRDPNALAYKPDCRTMYATCTQLIGERSAPNRRVRVTGTESTKPRNNIINDY